MEIDIRDLQLLPGDEISLGNGLQYGKCSVSCRSTCLATCAVTS